MITGLTLPQDANSAGNFSPSRDITGIEKLKQQLMQDALTSFVLDSELKESFMSEAAENSHGANATAQTDEQLMVAFSRGSTEAFSELFSRYKQRVFGFFRRRVPDPAQAEELAQETFLAILRGSSRYEPRALFRTYLYAIGFKILRAHRRKTAFRATFL